MTNREVLCDMGYEEAVVFENPDYDSAIIGVSSDERVVYRYSLMIEHLMVEDEMSMEEAIDFIDYNTLRSMNYIENPPIVVFDLM